ncbi:MAG: Mu transposase domain-containing protein, partial [Solirubrobacteraceae bacterium]
PTPYVFGEWRRARVHIDYHVEVEHNYYSAPYQLIGEVLDVRLAAMTVEVFHRGQRVASHPRLLGKGNYHTEGAHRPAAQRAYLDWSPERFVNWATTVGPRTAEFVAVLMSEKQHPEQGYRSCLGVMRLAKTYPHERVEAAAARALRLRVHTFRSLKSILDRGLDRQPMESEPETALEVPSHPNVRGAAYFTEGEGAGRC